MKGWIRCLFGLHDWGVWSDEEVYVMSSFFVLLGRDPDRYARPAYKRYCLRCRARQFSE